ncbi:MAG TPA: hypothetical protein VGR22_06915 [Thermomicrobiales bacterium]|nr:hypothetical protein [Thermomicrobiales bacterium]
MAAIVPIIGVERLEDALRFYARIPGFSIAWVHRRGDMGPATMAGLAWHGCAFVLVDDRCGEVPHAAGQRAIQITSRCCEQLTRSLTTVHSASRLTRPDVAWTDALVAIVQDPFGIEWHLFDEDAWMRETGGPAHSYVPIRPKTGVIAP